MIKREGRDKTRPFFFAFRKEYTAYNETPTKGFAMELQYVILLIFVTNVLTASIVARWMLGKKLKKSSDSFATAYVLGEEQALRNHKKVLEAYHHLFPNAK